MHNTTASLRKQARAVTPAELVALIHQDDSFTVWRHRCRPLFADLPQAKVCPTSSPAGRFVLMFGACAPLTGESEVYAVSHRPGFNDDKAPVIEFYNSGVVVTPTATS